MGFSDAHLAHLWKCTEREVFEKRREYGIFPVYKMIDTCASEFESYVPYFYSTYEEENESVVSDKPKVVVLGAGPIRIGQGVEFDYSTVHAVKTIRAHGYEAIIINNNPETVSTDYTTSDKLYFEPLTVEDVMNVIELEKPLGVIATLGGQTAINLAEPLMEHGVKLIGTDCEAIERAENRDSFEKLLLAERIPQPEGRAVTSVDAGAEAAKEIGYPVLVRPSFVLGGRAMQIVADETALRYYLENAVRIDEKQPVLVDRYISGRECEVDAVCDGVNVFVPGHHGARRAHGRPLRRLHKRLPALQPQRACARGHTRLHPPPRPRHRHRRPLQHPVHRGQERRRVHHRGQPALFPHRALHQQGHGLVPRRHRHARHAGRQPARAGDNRALPARQRTSSS